MRNDFSVLRRLGPIVATFLLPAMAAAQTSHARPCTSAGPSPTCGILTPADVFVRSIYWTELGGPPVGMTLARVAATAPLPTAFGTVVWRTAGQASPERSRMLLGPSQVERPWTNGRHAATVGLAYQHMTLVSVSGIPLDNLGFIQQFGSLTFDTHANMAVTIDRAVMTADYGLFDRVDVGLVVPFGHTEASSDAHIVQIFNGRTESEGTISVRSARAGFGDIGLRTKVALVSWQSFGLAAIADLRLPTGDVNALLGSGKWGGRIAVSAATAWGPVAPHVDTGYTLAGRGIHRRPSAYDFQPSDEVQVAFGVDVAATPRVTISGDAVGRRLLESADVRSVTTSDPIRLISVYTVVPGAVTPWTGALGVTANAARSWAVTGTVLFPLNDEGVKPGVSVMFGLRRLM